MLSLQAIQSTAGGTASVIQTVLATQGWVLVQRLCLCTMC
jgi:hypothetical protein